jgi:hypothetical protein
VTVVPQAQNGQLIISEFRFRGPTFNPALGIDGSLDEYVELYNTTNNAVTVATTDGSAGFALVALDAAGTNTAKLGTIPAGTIIPGHGHYLFAHQLGANGGYGLDAYATGDSFFTTDIADTGGVALFRTDSAGGFDAASELDAVGFNNTGAALPLLYREGTALTSAGANDGQYAFLRKLNSGTPQDTGNNAFDFIFVSTNGASFGGVLSTLGAPGPENLSSPLQRNATIKASLVDTGAASTAPPNRVRDFTSDSANNSTLGTLDVRRRFKNNTGSPVTRLRFRIVDMTTFPPPSGTADMRARTSGDIVVSLTGGGTATVVGTTLEQPANQPIGGGINSSMSAGTITLATPLAAGASINVHFLLGVQQAGAFRFFINVEALP